jgi:hypothetical protein
VKLVRTADTGRTPTISVAQTTPWTLRDFARLVRYELPAFIAIVVCFVGARKTSNWDHQLYWAVGAMAAMLLAGAGWTGWLLVGSRVLRQRQRRLGVVTAHLAPADEPAVTDNDLMVTGHGMTHFHRPGCPLTHGRNVSAGSADEHRAQGLTPCGVCLG